jgi:hypothetical protein
VLSDLLGYDAARLARLAEAGAFGDEASSQVLKA